MQQHSWGIEETERPLYNSPSPGEDSSSSRKSKKKTSSTINTNRAEQDHQTLQLFSTANQIPLHTLKHEPLEIHQLSLVLETPVELNALRSFVNLQELTLVSQRAVDVSPLENCTKLQKLWLQYNDIDCIDPLLHCKDLKFLDISFNKLKKLPSAADSPLVHLEQLCVAANRLESLGDLRFAPALQRLNASSNRLTSCISSSCVCSQSLRVLQLSDNRISRYDDLLLLRLCENLEELNLRDADWGQNPVCFMQGYFQFVVFQLWHLRILDKTFVTEHIRAHIQSTFYSKRLYYSMKGRCLKNEGRDAIRFASRHYSSRRKVLIEQYRKLKLAILIVQKRETKNGAAEKWKALLEDRRCVVHNCIRSLMAAWNNFKLVLRHAEARELQRLQLEYRHIGATRFEPISLESSWGMLLQSMIKQRFRAKEFAAFGIEGLKVSSVVKICHKMRQTLFEMTRDSFGDSPGKLGLFSSVVDPHKIKDYSNFLFYIPVLENGHPSIERYALDGFEDFAAATSLPFVPFTNSVATAVLPFLRLQAKAERLTPLSSMTLLLCSTCFVHQEEDSTSVYPEDSDPKDLWSQNPSKFKGHRGPPASCRAHNGVGYAATEEVCPDSVKAEDFLFAVSDPLARYEGRSMAVFRNSIGNPSAKLWWSLHHAFAIPEALIRIDFLPSTPPAVELQEEDAPEISVVEIQEALANLLFATNRCTAEEQNFPQGLAYLLNAQQLEYEAEDRALLSASALGRDAKEIVLSAVGFSTAEPSLWSMCAILEYLDISHNKISRFADLHFGTEDEPSLPNLRALDMSYNFIHSAETGFYLPKLQRLLLDFNFFQSVDDVTPLRSALPQLDQLSLFGNPVTDSMNYTQALFAFFPTLSNLDDSETLRQHISIPCSATTIESWVNHNITTATNGTCPNAQSRIDEEGPVIDFSIDRPLAKKTQIDHLDVLNVSNSFLLAIPPDIDRLVMLKTLDISNNCLTAIDALAGLHCLENACLDNNQIHCLLPLNSCKKLLRLEAASNHLEQLSLSELPCLSVLALESNSISSISVFKSLPMLKEVYLSGNTISDQRSLLQLRTLKHLAVLSIATNPFAKCIDHRLFLIFHLKELRVLDGVAVQPSEKSKAKKKFTGQLSVEFLEDRFGDITFCEMSSLDLSSCNLRGIPEGVVNSNMFPNLRRLVLSNNFLTCLTQIGPLPSLLELVLSGNRVNTETLLLVLPSLQSLDLSSNCSGSLDAFSKCTLTSICKLNLDNNQLLKLDGLQNIGLTLQDLSLNGNRLRSLDRCVLDELGKLKCLSVDDNGLKSVEAVGGLNALEVLSATSNRIPDLEDLESLKGLSSLSSTNFSLCPVSRKPLYRVGILRLLPNLARIDDLPVLEEERTKAAVLDQLAYLSTTSSSSAHFVLENSSPALPPSRATLLKEQTPLISATSTRPAILSQRFNTARQPVISMSSRSVSGDNRRPLSSTETSKQKPRVAPSIIPVDFEISRKKNFSGARAQQRSLPPLNAPSPNFIISGTPAVERPPPPTFTNRQVHKSNLNNRSIK